ncbi:polyketide synthase dehydratase domain-containing protein, partial [Parafrankia elaeagni]|uniref:polyketide synthase dehydratase domain-containing protein n=1 Tax=Parafrankia elaeagni TaxID=222534 RepID=UPI00054F0B88
VSTLRRGREEAATLLGAVAELFVTGARVDWASVFEGSGARHVDLPTYAFQHQRFWLDAAAPAGDLSAAGLRTADHPLLGATVMLADGDGMLLTGRLSTAAPGWLADHTVFGAPVVPGTALLELVLAAGRRVGTPVVAELILQAPLPLPDHGGVRLQIAVGPIADSGHREVTVHAQPEDGDEAAWTLHATGVLAPAESSAALIVNDLVVWPPAGAEPLPVEGTYPALADAGLGYGPAFQGLRRAWWRDGEVFAEVATPAATDGYDMHPALLDAALHAIGLGGLLPEAGMARLPFAFSTVRMFTSPGGAMRVRLALGDAPDTISLVAADDAGLPAVAIDGLTLRPAARDRFSAGVDAAARLLYGLDWVG